MINSRKIEDLTPEAQAKCKEFIAKCKEAGLTIKIIQTLRDGAYQNSLYKQGRFGDKGKIVTYKDGLVNKSVHQLAKAWDAVPVDAKGAIEWTNLKKFEQMASIAKSLDIMAGFYWKMKDSPHFEID